MIPLRVRIQTDIKHAFVTRLNRFPRIDTTPFDAYLQGIAEGDSCWYENTSGRFQIYGLSPSDQEGDVILVLPDCGSAHRLIRATSPHNTLLVTERCDQQCVMCSQPPKNVHIDHFPMLHDAVRLAPTAMTLGLSGGEPLLYKAQLFTFLQSITRDRSDLSFHILTNGQHFSIDDSDILVSLPRDKLIWGVPLYSDCATIHDQIVAKVGAFNTLLPNLALLARCGTSIELRTVVTRWNIDRLPTLAHFITRKIPFIARWAIMQMENIGYGRKNWADLFYDSSLDFSPIAEAIDTARACDTTVALYNFPLCTVPSAYSDLAVSSISDWKRRYLDECSPCARKETCGGFFTWYPKDNGFQRLEPA